MRLAQRLLFAGFIISFVLVGALAILSFVQTTRLSRRVERVEHSYKVVNVINQMNKYLLSTDKSAFRFVILRDSSYFFSFNELSDSLTRLTDTLKAKTTDNSAQQDNVVMLKTDEAVYLKSCRDLFNMPPLPLNELIKSPAIAENKQKLQQAVQLLGEMTAAERQLLRERTAEREVYLQLTTSMMRTLSIIFSILTIVLFFFLLREFERRVSYQGELQLKIAEIFQSKRELEYIAYATSHDLQEPLRKIRILTDRWHNQYQDKLSPEGNDMMERIISSASRMQDLVGELMMLASLNADAKKVPVPLGDCVQEILAQFGDSIAARKAIVETGPLPTVQGFPDQLKLLFKNLLDNALKFSKSGEPPHISITSRKASGDELNQTESTILQYYCISVADHGIGFDNRQADKMFGIFRQLNAAQEGYKGKGTGLAICQRIMTNHRGHILAHGFPGEGATFKLYFPIEG